MKKREKNRIKSDNNREFYFIFNPILVTNESAESTESKTNRNWSKTSDQISRVAIN